MSYDFSAAGYLDTTFPSGRAAPISMFCWIKKADFSTDFTYAMHLTEVAGDSTPGLELDAATGTADRLGVTTRQSDNSIAAQFEDFAAGEFDNTWVAWLGVWTSDVLRNLRLAELNGSTQGGTDNTTDKTAGSALDYLRIGLNVTGFTQWGGLIAEPAVWSKALDSTDFDLLKSGIVPGIVQNVNCIGYWPLDTDQATHADQSGNDGPILTVQSAAAFDSDHPIVASGLSGFHGANRGIMRGVARGIG